MTYEEALIIIKDMLWNLKFMRSEWVGSPMLNIMQRRFDALTKAIEAIETQIPKKAIEDGYNNGELVCPKCGREVNTTVHRCKCGQRIDWSAPECCKDCGEYKAFDGYSSCKSIEKYGYCSKALGEELEL